VYCKRKDLELKPQPNGKLLKPKAIYTLTSEEAKAVCQWLKDLRMPGGYCSNLGRCADVKTGRVNGMKSHDNHVFMEHLLPSAFSPLPSHVLNPITEISQFFKNICASTLRVNELEKLDKLIPIILCQLKQFFPHVFLTLWNNFRCIWHMRLSLAGQFNIGGCTLLKDSWEIQNDLFKIGPRFA
jgi:hypothetical protein